MNKANREVTAPLDECLSARQGALYIEDVAATSLAERFGSPLYVVSEDQVRRNARRFQRAFGEAWTVGNVKILPALKANWNLAVQRILAEEGCGADVYSAGELEIALRAGIDPDSISVNGVPKAEDHVRRTLEVGAKLTVDSLEDVRLLQEIAPHLPRPAKVRLRLRPAVSGFVKASDFVAEGPMPTDLAALGYKGGLSLEEVIAAGRQILAMKNVELVGFHQRHGRHDAGLEWWQAQMVAYAKMMGQVCEALYGFSPKEIDIGGGYAIPRDPHNAATDYTAPYQYSVLYALSRLLALFGEKVRYRVVSKLVGIMRTRPNQVAAPSIERYAAAACETLLRELPKQKIETRGIELQLEPGRAIFGNAGVHLSRVRNVKRQHQPMPWNVVSLDTSEFFLTAGRFEHHLHDHVVANKVGAPPALVADVTGRSCFADRLLSAVELPNVEVGDLFAFLDTGAYQEGSASNFNAMTRPATALVRGSEAYLIKAAETLDEVLLRERVPEHLAAKVRRSERAAATATA